MDWFLQTKASRANTGVRESKSEHPHSNLQIEFGFGLLGSITEQMCLWEIEN